MMRKSKAEQKQHKKTLIIDCVVDRLILERERREEDEEWEWEREKETMMFKYYNREEEVDETRKTRTSRWLKTEAE